MTSRNIIFDVSITATAGWPANNNILLSFHESRSKIDCCYRRRRRCRQLVLLMLLILSLILCNPIGVVATTNNRKDDDTETTTKIVAATAATISNTNTTETSKIKSISNKSILNDNNNNAVRYGVDCSFPIHYPNIRCYNDNDDDSNNNNNDEKIPLHYFHHNRRIIYDNYIKGCLRKFGKRRGNECHRNERIRFELNLKQPVSIINYTLYGYQKSIVPSELFILLTKHYNSYSTGDSKQFQQQKQQQMTHDGNRTTVISEQIMVEEEIWNIGDTFTNHWDVPTYIIPIEDTTILQQQQQKQHGSTVVTPTTTATTTQLKKRIWNTVRNKLEQWTGMEQKPISMYGIRQYTAGAIIPPHVTRLPMVCSCIICIASTGLNHDNTTTTTITEEIWPLEIYDRNGYAVNITLKPGEMLLYESSSLIIGRPFPLRQQNYAELYIHFEPTGRNLNDFYPPYLVRDSPALDEWRILHQEIQFVSNDDVDDDDKNSIFDPPTSWIQGQPPISTNTNKFTTKTTTTTTTTTKTTATTKMHQHHSPPKNNFHKSPEAHVAASIGDVKGIIQLGKINQHLLLRRDANGWQPIHEATRAGHINVVKVLIEQFTVNVNSRTGIQEDGHTPLSIAFDRYGKFHTMVQYLRAIGGKTPGELDAKLQQQQQQQMLHSEL
jgi:prolyl 4-hydroxylase